MPLLRRNNRGGILGLGILGSNPPSPSTQEVMFKDTMWEELERRKRAEWTAAGYSPSLQDMAIDLAHSYATGISPWISEVSGVSKEEVERKLFEYGLSTVAESWIRKMSK